MLLAELHGHDFRELTDNEDYLTSAVFGHLRYVQPAVFWPLLFSRATGLPQNNQPTSLTAFLYRRGIALSAFATLDTYFWPTHEVWGVPDLLLHFSAEHENPLVIICEAKLWSGKSGRGSDDQLLRYMKALSSLKLFRPHLPGDLVSATAALLYITPRDSLGEVVETTAECALEPELTDLLFRVQWQDVTEAADEAASVADRTTRLILNDVSQFLKRRGLQYFRGFSQCAAPEPSPPDGAFYESKCRFAGFEANALPSDISFASFYNRHVETQNRPNASAGLFSAFQQSVSAHIDESMGRFYKQ